jgi:hypothetical protein
MREWIAIVVGLWPALQALGMAAYLPVIGPAPLRFLPPPSKPRAHCVWTLLPPDLPIQPRPTNGPPPLSVADEAGGLSGNGADAENVAQCPPTVDPTALANLMTNRQFNSVSGAADSSFFTPQMMMPFFQAPAPGTNNTRFGVWGSVLFVPPVPSGRPTSKAAYTSP